MLVKINKIYIKINYLNMKKRKEKEKRFSQISIHFLKNMLQKVNKKCACQRTYN